jgi:hypothetical protein
MTNTLASVRYLSIVGNGLYYRDDLLACFDAWRV